MASTSAFTVAAADSRQRGGPTVRQGAGHKPAPCVIQNARGEQCDGSNGIVVERG